MEKTILADELRALEARINALLPPRYIGCFEDVSPKSMGSAKLRYDSNGKVVWGEIWTTFCHLALAGGPPHRGRLLGPVSAEDVQRAPEAYNAVVAELQRAFGACVDLPLVHATSPGWIGLQCDSVATAVWLVRAIVAENVIARNEGSILLVPAGPDFRIEKEIKNVVVCVAKTCHYLFDHLEPEQQPTGEAPTLTRPSLPDEITALGSRYEQAAGFLQQKIHELTQRQTSRSEAQGWIGMECDNEETAVWLLRAIAVENILVRREEASLYVPVDHLAAEAALAKTADAVDRAVRLSGLRVK